MIGPFLSGAILGLVLAMMIGPVFFMIVNTSLKQGFIPAALLAIGIMLANLTLLPALLMIGHKDKKEEKGSQNEELPQAAE